MKKGAVNEIKVL